MPQFNLLLLPLLGGFIFVSLWYPTKYYTKRADTYRLVFTASIFGAVFLFLASVTSVLLATHLPEPSRQIYHIWHQVFPHANSGKATLAGLMGALLWWPLNFFCKDQNAIRRAIINRKDPLETLLRKALGENKMIAVTLQNRKVYIGHLTVNFNPAFDMQSISIFPSASGHRDKDTLHMELTLDYMESYENIKAEAEKKVQEEFNTIRKSSKNEEQKIAEIAKLLRPQLDRERLRDFEIAIPMSEVQSIFIFDPKTYERHFESRRQHETNNKVSFEPSALMDVIIAVKNYVSPENQHIGAKERLIVRSSGEGPEQDVQKIKVNDGIID